MTLPLAANLPPPSRAKRLLADAALALMFACAIALCGMSEALLDRLGLHYTRSGGLPWEKFHPGTILAALALAARIASFEHAEAARGFLRRERALLIFLLAVLIAALHAVFVSGNPVTGLVDTFVLPVLLVLLIDDLRPDLRRRLAVVLCVCVGLNACIGLSEFLFDWRLVPAAVSDPYDPTDYRAQAAIDWRATALLGHPLQNAVVTGAFILCLASGGCRWLPTGIRILLVTVATLSMAAFGGRASLVLTVAGLVAFAGGAAARHLLSGRRLPHRRLALAFIAAPFLAMGVVLVIESGIFSKLIERFVDDQGSAKARVVMWDMFDPLSWTDILFGPDPAVVRTTQRLLGIELGIESFWVAISLDYGLIVASGLFLGLGLLSWRLIASRRPGAASVLLFYFAVASTSTGLSSKTTGLGLVTLMVLALLQKSPRHTMGSPAQS